MIYTCTSICFYSLSYYEYNVKAILKKEFKNQRGNQNSQIDEEQTTQWPKEKRQKYKQRSTKHYT